MTLKARYCPHRTFGPWHGEPRDEDMQYLGILAEGWQYYVVDDFGDLVAVGPCVGCL